MDTTTNVAPEFVGPAYEPMGKIEAGGELAYEYIAPKEPKDYGTVEEIRGMMVGHEKYFDSQEAYNKYHKFCEVTKIENIGGKEFHDLAESTYAYIHRPKGDDDGKCMVYFHGGAMIAGGPEQSFVFLNRYVAEANITIINVKYRLAPEARTPCQIADGYAAFMDVVTHPAKFGIDAHKVGLFGDSAGAYITAGVGMVLAEREQGHLARIQMQLSPGVSNCILQSEEWKQTAGLNEAELRVHAPFVIKMFGLISDKKTTEEWAKDRYLFPNEMGDQLAAKVPPVVILTAEFDSFRYSSQEARDLYQKNGKLIQYIELGGGYHCSWMNYAMAQTNVWYKDFTRLTQFYLQ
jgi:acetyl esterase/lipase